MGIFGHRRPRNLSHCDLGVASRENERGGTLIELKRFLIEDVFRNSFLKNINDPSLHYYWNNEYPMVKKRIAPLLTRIDTFLRPKLVRYMLAQKKGVEISDCLAENKIVLLKLSQGLIGEENSYLLGSLFLAKFNQSGNRIWSTYYGGNRSDYSYAVAVNETTNNVMMSGDTYSPNLPVSPCALQTSIRGLENGFIGQFYPDGSIYCSSYFGNNH